MTDGPTATPLRIRQGVRALLLTPGREILLVRFEFTGRTIWALPGGGLEPGEDDLTGLCRELVEEVGLVDPVVGPHVWSREHIFPFDNGLWDGQRDRMYLVETAECFEPTPALTWEQLREERLHELRWWHIDDIARGADDDRVSFAPRRLGALLARLVADGPPPSPLDTGI